MMTYKLSEKYSQGLSFEMIERMNICEGARIEIIEYMFKNNFGPTQLITDIDAIMRIAQSHHNIEWLIERKLIERYVIETTYRLRQFFEKNSNNYYILCQSSTNHICLICLADGNRYTDAIEVKDIDTITETEFTKACGNCRGDFAEVNPGSIDLSSSFLLPDCIGVG